VFATGENEEGTFFEQKLSSAAASIILSMISCGIAAEFTIVMCKVMEEYILPVGSGESQSMFANPYCHVGQSKIRTRAMGFTVDKYRRKS